MQSHNPYADVQPAPYALPDGVPALQSDPSITRRWLLSSVVAAFALGAAGAVAFTRGSPPVKDQMREKRLEWARRCAAGPENVLHDKADMFLSVVELYGGDELIWSGVEKITRKALALPLEERAWTERVLAALTASRADLPRPLCELKEQLERRLRPGAPRHR